MPLTFSHVAAILPAGSWRRAHTANARFASRFVDVPALAIGAMAPDGSYVIALAGPYVEMHTLSGTVLAAWPLALVAYALYRFRLCRPWHQLLPWLDDGGGPRRPAAVFAGTLVGVLTHYVWDAFTHVDGAAVLQWPWLSHPWTLGPWQGPLCDALQDASSVVGAAVLAYAIARTIRSQRNGCFTTSWPKLFALLGAFTILWLLIGAAVHPSAVALPPREYASQLAFAGLGATALVFVAYGFLAQVPLVAAQRK